MKTLLKMSIVLSLFVLLSGFTSPNSKHYNSTDPLDGYTCEDYAADVVSTYFENAQTAEEIQLATQLYIETLNACNQLSESQAMELFATGRKLKINTQ